MRETKKSPNISRNLRSEQYEFLLLLMPMILAVLIFCYIPMAGIMIGFCNLKPGMSVFQMKWVGLKWFEKLMTDQNFWRALRNTIRVSLTNFAFAFPLPIVFALLVNEIKVLPYKRIAQSASFFPHFISTVIVVQLLFNFFGYQSGLVNTLLQNAGHEKINFFLQAKFFIPFYVGTTIWQSTGWSSVIYLSAITSIDMNIYEAAKIDGAGRFRQMSSITLPSLKPTIAMLLILNLGNILNVGYEKVLLIYNPAIYDTADILSTYMYRIGLIDWQFSYSTAMGLFNQSINLIVLITANTLSKKIIGEGLW